MILRRKYVNNTFGFFIKNFTEYQEGFEANGKRFLCGSHSKQSLGELWIGLDKLHNLTSTHSYGLKIIMTDFDNSTYSAFYNRFKVRIACTSLKMVKNKDLKLDKYGKHHFKKLRVYLDIA